MLTKILKENKIVLFTILIWIQIIQCKSQVQSNTLSTKIAAIISKNCSSCHYKNGPSTVYFNSLKDVIYNKSLINYVIENKIMPPWKADINYSHFINERIISIDDKNELLAWLNSNPSSDMDLKIKPTSVIKNTLGKPDKTITINEPHKVLANNQDEFATYVEELKLKSDRYLRAIEIIPGNKSLVHHCRIDLDTIDVYSKFKNKNEFIHTKDITDLYQPKLQFVGDYVPGISAYQYPRIAGLKIDQTMKVLINLHYSPSSIEATDLTKVNFYFYPKKYIPREIVQSYLSSQNIIEDNMVVEANQKLSLHMEGDPLLNDMSLIAVQPHMHLIGQYFKLIAMSPKNDDSIRLITINDWNFNWQENYYFNSLIKIPQGWRFIVDGTFDNTTSNPNNPSNPPKDIKFNGEMNTTNEMFEFYFHALRYEPGDENLSIK